MSRVLAALYVALAFVNIGFGIWNLLTGWPALGVFDLLVGGFLIWVAVIVARSPFWSKK